MLNLTQLQALPVDLHLGIFSATENDFTVLIVPNKISCLVQTTVCSDALQPGWTVNKNVCCSLGIIQVASRNSWSFNQELANTSNGAVIKVSSALLSYIILEQYLRETIVIMWLDYPQATTNCSSNNSMITINCNSPVDNTCNRALTKVTY